MTEIVLEMKDGKWYKHQDRGLWDPTSLESIAQQLGVYISDVADGSAHSVTLTIENRWDPADIVFRGWWLASKDEVEKRKEELAEIEANERVQLAKLLAKYPQTPVPVPVPVSVPPKAKGRGKAKKVKAKTETEKETGLVKGGTVALESVSMSVSRLTCSSCGYVGTEDEIDGHPGGITGHCRNEAVCNGRT